LDLLPCRWGIPFVRPAACYIIRLLTAFLGGDDNTPNFDAGPRSAGSESGPYRTGYVLLSECAWAARQFSLLNASARSICTGLPEGGHRRLLRWKRTDPFTVGV
jgi:hypothetical protein